MTVRSHKGTKQGYNSIPFISVSFSATLHVSSKDHNQEANIKCAQADNNTVAVAIQDHVNHCIHMMYRQSTE
jgi:hypothetical protein